VTWCNGAHFQLVEDAVADATTAIDLQPGDTDTLATAYLNRSAALGRSGREEEAIVNATAAIDLEPNNINDLAQAHMNRSIALGEIGRTDEAVVDLQTVLQVLPPTHALSREAVGRLADLGISE
jgi:tetratricopeptide (TPR) repeat protein